MINTLLKRISDNSVIAKNFLALGSLQLINFLLPLLIAPYLIRVLGLYNFGLVALSQAVISFFIITTDYGFNLTATREVAIIKDDKAALEKLFREVLTTKLFLLVAGAALLYAGVLLTTFDQPQRQLYLFTYTLAVGQALLPLWFFQGIEDMKYITYFSVLAKILATACVFIFIKEKDHFIYVNLLHGASTILAGLVCIYFLNRRYKISFKPVSFFEVINQLKKGWHIFVSNFTINIYIVSNIIILGFFSSKEMVGYYSVAEKIINAVRQILVVFFQVTYPHVCKIASETKYVIHTFFKKVYVPFIILIAMFSLGVFILAEPIVVFFTNSTNSYVQSLLRILSFVPIIVALNIPANQLLLAYNIRKHYSYTLIFGSCINLLVNSVLSYYMDAVGTAIAVLVTEIFITAGLYFVLRKVLSKKAAFLGKKNIPLTTLS